MIRRAFVGLALLCSAADLSAAEQVLAVAASKAQPAVAKTLEPQAAMALPDARSRAMIFEWRREGPVADCGADCRTWISAIGAITADTARDFENFAKDARVRGATVVLDSEGGSVLGALALGRAFRRLAMTTSIGRSVSLPEEQGARRSRLLPDAYCESMCGFALLGGARRHVPPEAHVMVHQIWLGDRRSDAVAATYSAEDLVLVQRDIGSLAQYTVEMGGDIDLLETALRIPPWEPMRTLSRDEIGRMRLSTVDEPFEKAPPASATNAAPAAAVVPAALHGGAINEHGWTLVRGERGSMLARRHPLTVEGENIGRFDIVLTCGASRDQIAVHYTETRSGQDASRPPAALREVTMSLGRTTVKLDIASTQPQRPARLSSRAQGVVALNAIQELAKSSGRVLTVATANAGGGRTSIRVGTSGLTGNFPQFAADCAGLAPSKSAQLAN